MLNVKILRAYRPAESIEMANNKDIYQINRDESLESTLIFLKVIGLPESDHIYYLISWDFAVDFFKEFDPEELYSDESALSLKNLTERAVPYIVNDDTPLTGYCSYPSKFWQMSQKSQRAVIRSCRLSEKALSLIEVKLKEFNNAH